ncbi:hypothetical protein AVEN_28692-1 [Araneus ventricosus]|uniref:Uncharacterized protein n=1 Tax=Araneus ventricosus TaxID=182803 RepID=A0A4Y2I2W5_ARAVE|nr:hypothetical protein AVEN_28692-1 [Araneus ventricosus]
MECFRKLLAEVETDEVSDIDNEDNGSEDDLEDNFSDHESFSEHDKEVKEDGDSLNEENAKVMTSSAARNADVRSDCRKACWELAVSNLGSKDSIRSATIKKIRKKSGKKDILTVVVLEQGQIFRLLSQEN